MGGTRSLPDGVVTLLMTDVSGSTRLWEERPDIAGDVLDRHEAVIETSVLDHGGVMIRSKGEGDSTFSVFTDPSRAASAAVEVQRALRREPWPDDAVCACAPTSTRGTSSGARATTTEPRITAARGCAAWPTRTRSCAPNPPRRGCAACRSRSSSPIWGCTARGMSPEPNVSSS